MNHFLLLFRGLKRSVPHAGHHAVGYKPDNLSEWINHVSESGHFVSAISNLNRLGAFVVTQHDTIKGPYVQSNTIVDGYLIIKAASVDDAIMISKSCPIIANNGSIEIRCLVLP